MTNDTRGAIADLAVLSAVSIAVYFLATKPGLRRAAGRLVRYGVLTVAPALLRQEVTRAWSLSAARDSGPGIRTAESI
jgi:hypothetical protein